MRVSLQALVVLGCNSSGGASSEIKINILNTNYSLKIVRLATLLEVAGYQKINRAIFQQSFKLLWCFKAVKLDKYESQVETSVCTIDRDNKNVVLD